MVLVFDIGGTNTRLALAEGGVLGEVVRLPTERGEQGLTRFLAAAAKLAGSQGLTAVAGGFPGQLDDAGVVMAAPNLPKWIGKRLGAEIRDRFECPVYWENDVVLCGRGEAAHGAGSRQGVMAYYTVSTGVNAVRLVDGAVDRGVARYELGKQLLLRDGAGWKSLEAMIGGGALEERWGKPPREVRDPAVWQEIERCLAAGLYNTVLYWNPAVVVLGGSMMRDIDLKVVARELAKFPLVFERWPRLERASLGDEAGLYGGLAWLQELGRN
ncbi:MAG TPA: ROK family protein [Candidatus Saccharimonadia bacterium]|nr:ROK family protein [Candidatus Saccharimonadia bacterium]